MARIGRMLGALAVGAATVAVLPGAARADDGWASNAYGTAHFVGDGDKLSTCDVRTDGVLVRASIQQYYSSTNSWQAIGTNDAPSSACDTKVVDVEPDTALVRIHIWGEKSGTKISDSDGYSTTFHATP